MSRPDLPARDSQPDRQLTLEAAQSEFGAEVTYLNTATLGLPPRRSWDALQLAQAQWRAGTSDPVAYDSCVESARAAYARLVNVPRSCVAVGSQTSVFAGLVAASLPAGSEVLTAEGDFTSIVFPFLAQAADAGRRVTVREVPLEHLADAVRAHTTLVSVSAVQSADGRVADLEALRTACKDNDARVLLDTTQAIGWLPVDAGAFAYTVCSGYKWLLAPRGTAYLTVQPELMDDLLPHHAGWYAGETPWSSIYGGPLRLAPDARRFDVSPAWHSWVAAAPALDLLANIGRDPLHGHAVGLADRFRSELGLPERESAIVSLAVGDGAATALRDASVVGSMRAGRLRLAFHLPNRVQDVDHALEVIAPHVSPA